MASSPLYLAPDSCAGCNGTGERSKGIVCRCVWRAVYRCVMEAAFSDSEYRGQLRQVEYRADVELAARRTLSPPRYTIWAARREGLEWHSASRETGLNRGEYFHEVYRIEALLGRTFAMLRPYPLFPSREYYTAYSHPARHISAVQAAA